MGNKALYTSTEAWVMFATGAVVVIFTLGMMLSHAHLVKKAYVDGVNDTITAHDQMSEEAFYIWAHEMKH